MLRFVHTRRPVGVRNVVIAVVSPDVEGECQMYSEYMHTSIWALSECLHMMLYAVIEAERVNINKKKGIPVCTFNKFVSLESCV